MNGTYEPEIDWLLRRAGERPYAMLDAGANYGFWSILASSAPYGRHPTIAIEPARANYDWLVRNATAMVDGSRRCAGPCSIVPAVG